MDKADSTLTSKRQITRFVLRATPLWQKQKTLHLSDYCIYLPFGEDKNSEKQIIWNETLRYKSHPQLNPHSLYN